MKIHNEHIREKVNKSAKKLLYAHGVKGWNMTMLASEAGLARNTLYKIIGSKEKLVEAIVLCQLRERAESILDFVREDGNWGDKEAAIKTLERAIKRFAKNMSLFEPIIVPQIYREYPAIESKVDAEVERLSTLAHFYFDKGKEAGFIRKDVDSEVCMEVVSIIIKHYIQQGTHKSIFEDQVKKVLEYILVGIMA